MRRFVNEARQEVLGYDELESVLPKLAFSAINKRPQHRLGILAFEG